MLTYRFDDEHDVTGTINALRCAAERFTDHAAESKKLPHHERLVRQFTDQAAQARRIADEIEQICA